jgi:hypothetical protein
MCTVGTEGEGAGKQENAAVLVASIHKTLYRTIYQVSTDIVEVLGPKLVRGKKGEREEQTHPLPACRGQAQPAKGRPPDPSLRIMG